MMPLLQDPILVPPTFSGSHGPALMGPPQGLIMFTHIPKGLHGPDLTGPLQGPTTGPHASRGPNGPDPGPSSCMRDNAGVPH